MKPGDWVDCACGLRATAYTTGDPARWREGEALMVSWAGYRHEAVLTAPARCLFCADRSYPRAAPTRRVAICDDLAVNGCRTDGFEWATDADVEDAYQRWISAGRRKLALVAVHPLPSVAGEGPLNGRGAPEAEGALALPPGKTDGNKAPLERPRAQLGLF